MKVFVYFNLHKKCFSIKALEGENKGRVVAHAKELHLTDATFKVSEAGRQRVLRTNQKNVHAGVVGQWTGEPVEMDLGDLSNVTYDPRRYTSFVERFSETPVHTAKKVWLENKRIFANL